jgi:hypothetical protein
LISHFHHLVADKIYTHHKNLVAGQHVEIFGRFGYVFYPRHVGSLSEWKPELGDYLGDLTDEVPDNRIVEFVTGGLKNYAYKIAKPDKDGNTTICKVRGITLN